MPQINGKLEGHLAITLFLRIPGLAQQPRDITVRQIPQGVAAIERPEPNFVLVQCLTSAGKTAAGQNLPDLRMLCQCILQ